MFVDHGLALTIDRPAELGAAEGRPIAQKPLDVPGIMFRAPGSFKSSLCRERICRHYVVVNGQNPLSNLYRIGSLVLYRTGYLGGAGSSFRKINALQLTRQKRIASSSTRH